MLKDLLDLIMSLANERAKRREKSVALLEHFSKDLDQLAEQWAAIARLASADPIPAAEIHERLSQQRGFYQAIRRFRDSLNEGSKSSQLTYQQFDPILDQAIGQKSQLYMTTMFLLGYDMSRGEVAELSPDIPEGIVNRLEYLKEARKKESPPSPSPRETALARATIRESSEEISGLAGAFRSEVALFKAQTPSCKPRSQAFTSQHPEAHESRLCPPNGPPRSVAAFGKVALKQCQYASAEGVSNRRSLRSISRRIPEVTWPLDAGVYLMNTASTA